MAYRGMWRWTDGVWLFVLSVQNRVCNFVRVCSDKQGIASTIDDDFIGLVKFVFTP